MTDRILSRRTLLRTLLARQLLLERSTLSIADAVERVGGLQTQYAPSGYVGLWTRVVALRREDYTAALEGRTLIQGTLMRTTIHTVSRREYWLYAMGVRQARRRWALRLDGPAADEAAMVRGAERLREALADGPRTVRELGELGAGFIGNLGLWVDIVRVPPSGTWERRRADRLALAEGWVGPPDATEEEGLAHLVRAYLRAFGPAPWSDIASWAGIPVAGARRGGEALGLVRYRDEDGRELVDLAGEPLADPDVAAPVRFLAHWDDSLLTHTRRTGLLGEELRSRIFSIRNPASVGAYLVDGSVAGAWSFRDGRIALDPFVDLAARDRRAVERERAALEAFCA